MFFISNRYSDVNANMMHVTFLLACCKSDFAFSECAPRRSSLKDRSMRQPDKSSD
jgi:hypothetical protein